MNRRERFATEEAAVAAPSLENPRIRTFPVEEGGVYTLHALLLCKSGQANAGEAKVACEFADADGHVIPPEYDATSATVGCGPRARGVFQRPGRAPARRQLLRDPVDRRAAARRIREDRARREPALRGRQAGDRAAHARRVSGKADKPSCDRREGAGRNSVRLRKALEAAGVGTRLRTGDLAVSAKRQINPVVAAESQFSWLKFSTYYSQFRASELLAERRRNTAKEHTFAFVGSERLYRQLSSRAHVMLVREDEPPHACLDLRPDALVLETCGEAVLVVVAPGALRLRGRDRRDRGGLARRSEGAQHSRPRDRLGAGARSLSRAHRACRPRHRRGHGRRPEFHPRRDPPRQGRPRTAQLRAHAGGSRRGDRPQRVPRDHPECRLLAGERGSLQPRCQARRREHPPDRRFRRPERDADRQPAAVHAVASGEQAAVSRASLLHAACGRGAALHGQPRIRRRAAGPRARCDRLRGGRDRAGRHDAARRSRPARHPGGRAFADL